MQKTKIQVWYKQGFLGNDLERDYYLFLFYYFEHILRKKEIYLVKIERKGEPYDRSQ
jgi:hypothetical protein